ncbi:MAG: hypothetical protein PHH47_01290 [Gallionella sp.]|nr:hypothetical protein [Gallionella sp.]MDD4946129.1 hypothetical protein [Gallionella sp.]MDD5612400.1 hypothetical protein [Gallionella sp.]
MNFGNCFRATTIALFLLIHPTNTWCTTEQADVRFPGSDIVLQDGDLLLYYNPTPLEGLNSLFGLPKGRYSHASVYVMLPKIGGRIVDFSARGLSEQAPAASLEQDYRIALVRPNDPPPVEHLATALSDIRKRVADGHIKFDYLLRWTAEDDGRYYCTEFISRLFRNAQLPDPFPLQSDSENNFWRGWVAENMDIDYSRIVSPNAPLHSPAFKLMAEYQRNDPAAQRQELELDTLLKQMEFYIKEQGRVPATPPLGSRLLVGMANAGFFTDQLIGGLPPKSRPILLVAHEFIVRVQERVERSVWLYEGEDWPPATIVNLTQRTADALRDKYFALPPVPR